MVLNELSNESGRTQRVRKICADGGIHLTKFVSNNKQALASIPEDKHRKVFLTKVSNLECYPQKRH